MSRGDDYEKMNKVFKNFQNQNYIEKNYKYPSSSNDFELNSDKIMNRIKPKGYFNNNCDRDREMSLKIEKKRKQLEYQQILDQQIKEKKLREKLEKEKLLKEELLYEEKCKLEQERQKLQQNKPEKYDTAYINNDEIFENYEKFSDKINVPRTKSFNNFPAINNYNEYNNNYEMSEANLNNQNNNNLQQIYVDDLVTQSTQIPIKVHPFQSQSQPQLFSNENIINRGYRTQSNYYNPNFRQNQQQQLFNFNNNSPQGINPIMTNVNFYEMNPNNQNINSDLVTNISSNQIHSNFQIPFNKLAKSNPNIENNNMINYNISQNLQNNSQNLNELMNMNLNNQNYLGKIMEIFFHEQEKIIESYKETIEKLKNERDEAIYKNKANEERILAMQKIQNDQDLLAKNLGYCPFKKEYGQNLEKTLESMTLRENVKNENYENENFNNNEYNIEDNNINNSIDNNEIDDKIKKLNHINNTILSDSKVESLESSTKLVKPNYEKKLLETWKNENNINDNTNIVKNENYEKNINENNISKNYEYENNINNEYENNEDEVNYGDFEPGNTNMILGKINQLNNQFLENYTDEDYQTKNINNEMNDENNKETNNINNLNDISVISKKNEEKSFMIQDIGNDDEFRIEYNNDNQTNRKSDNENELTDDEVSKNSNKCMKMNFDDKNKSIRNDEFINKNFNQLIDNNQDIQINNQYLSGKKIKNLDNNISYTTSMLEKTTKTNTDKSKEDFTSNNLISQDESAKKNIRNFKNIDNNLTISSVSNLNNTENKKCSNELNPFIIPQNQQNYLNTDKFSNNNIPVATDVTFKPTSNLNRFSEKKENNNIESALLGKNENEIIVDKLNFFEDESIIKDKTLDNKKENINKNDESGIFSEIGNNYWTAEKNNESNNLINSRTAKNLTDEKISNLNDFYGKFVKKKQEKLNETDRSINSNQNNKSIDNNSILMESLNTFACNLNMKWKDMTKNDIDNNNLMKQKSKNIVDSRQQFYNEDGNKNDDEEEIEEKIELEDDKNEDDKILNKVNKFTKVALNQINKK